MTFDVARRVAATLVCLGALLGTRGYAADDSSNLKGAVDALVQPTMQRYGVPGMAVGIVAGNQHYVFNYGVASRQTQAAVTNDTLFEIGSVSKTFTATLTSYAQLSGKLALTDAVGKYLPPLRGTRFGAVSLLNLGTHTPGGLPLQVPDGIRNNDQLLAYLAAWKPRYQPGTYRTYSNVGIGLLGLIAAQSMQADFAALMEQHLFPELGLAHTYINVPAAKLPDYAQGYTAKDQPIRMAGGVLSDEAYGIRTTAGDMVRFIAANLGVVQLDGKLQQAIADTHTGYFQDGAMTQDLIWEQYAYPVDLKTLLVGNADRMVLQPTPVTAIIPPARPRQDVLINKTGSTNGFSTYVAFVPEKRIGVVVLANKNYALGARVSLGYRILAWMGAHDSSH